MSAHSTNLQRLPSVEQGRRYFTVEQANKSLVLVRRIVGDILNDYQKVLDQQEILEVHQRAHEDGPSATTQATIVALVERLQACADELVDIGAELRDWAAGIVDFPCLAGGHDIQLCWQHGEPHIVYWHSSDQACNARQSIQTLPQ